jgi:hypothetical protein
VNVSPSAYKKAIKLCIDNRSPCQAERILRHCHQTNMPYKIVSDMYELVLYGYALNGDTKNVERLFNSIGALRISPR